MGQFTALLFKNLCLVRRRTKSTFFSIFSPISVMILLVILHRLTATFEPQTILPSYPDERSAVPLTRLNQLPVFRDNPDYQGKRIIYTPDNTYTRTVMNTLAASEGISVLGFNSEREALEYWFDDIWSFSFPLGLVTFSKNTTQNQSNFTARLLRPIGSSHFFNVTHVDVVKGTVVNVDIYELAVHRAVQEAILTVAMGSRVTLDFSFETMPSAPTPPRADFELRSKKFTLNVVTPLVLYTVLLIPFMINVNSLVAEKTSGVLRMLRSIGLRDSWYWLSWFIVLWLPAVIYIFVIVIMGIASGIHLFKNTDFFVMCTVLFFSTGSLVSFSLAISAPFKRPRSANPAAFLIVILALILGIIFTIAAIAYDPQYVCRIPSGRSTPAYTDETFYSNFNYGTVILYFFPPFNFFRIMDVMVTMTNPQVDPDSSTQRMVNNGFHFGWKEFMNIREVNTCYYWDEFSKGIVSPAPVSSVALLMMNCVFYLLLAGYFGQVFNTNSGSTKPCFFPCMPSYWSQRKQKRALQGDTIGKMQELSASTNSVVLHKISKTFKDSTALKELTLALKPGEVFCFLGHNGAGKSTTVNIISAQVEPTHGHCFVRGMSVAEDVDRIRASMGVCPQDDVLWSELTGREHLIFFSLFRKVPKSHRMSEITGLLEDVDLTEKANRVSSTYSGGMRRRLSVAISCIGMPPVILLDEPTTGLDPLARRRVWSLIQKLKANDRVILLTTHSMEEADLLSDRIALLSKGSLRAIGTPVFLKNRFGAGYNASVVCDPSKEAHLRKLIKKYMPVAEILDSSGGNTAVAIPRSAAGTHVPAFFRIIDEHAGNMIKEWGISNTTLEEVFMRLSAQNKAVVQNEAIPDHIGQGIANHSRAGTAGISDKPICKLCKLRPTEDVIMTTSLGVPVLVSNAVCSVCCPSTKRGTAKLTLKKDKRRLDSSSSPQPRSESQIDSSGTDAERKHAAASSSRVLPINASSGEELSHPSESQSSHSEPEGQREAADGYENDGEGWWRPGDDDETAVVAHSLSENSTGDYADDGGEGDTSSGRQDAQGSSGEHFEHESSHSHSGDESASDAFPRSGSQATRGVRGQTKLLDTPLVFAEDITFDRPRQVRALCGRAWDLKKKQKKANACQILVVVIVLIVMIWLKFTHSFDTDYFLYSYNSDRSSSYIDSKVGCHRATLCSEKYWNDTSYYYDNLPDQVNDFCPLDPVTGLNSTSSVFWCPSYGYLSYATFADFYTSREETNESPSNGLRGSIWYSDLSTDPQFVSRTLSKFPKNSKREAPDFVLKPDNFPEEVYRNQLVNQELPFPEKGVSLKDLEYFRSIIPSLGLRIHADSSIAKRIYHFTMLSYFSDPTAYDTLSDEYIWGNAKYPSYTARLNRDQDISLYHNSAVLSVGGATIILSSFINILSTVILRDITGDPAASISVRVQRAADYPSLVDPYRNAGYRNEETADQIDPYAFSAAGISSLLFTLATIFLFPSFIQPVVAEREDKSHKLMRIMGLDMKKYWLSYYLFNLMMGIGVVFLVLLVGGFMSIPPLNGNLEDQRTVLVSRTVAACLMVIFWLHAMIGSSALFAAIFARTRGAVLLAYVYILISTTAGVILIMIATEPLPTGAYVFPQFAFMFGWANMALNRSDGSKECIALFLEGFVCLGLAMLLEEVRSPQSGIRRWITAKRRGKHYSASDMQEGLQTRISSQVSAAVALDLAQDEDVIAEQESVLGARDESEYMILMKNLGVTYPGNFHAVKSVTMGLKADTCLGLLGPNGAGKTTLVSALHGAIKPTRGTISICGLDVTEHLSTIRHKMGVMPQYDYLFSELTVEEHLLMYARMQGVTKDAERACVQRVAEITELDGDSFKKLTSSLSGGQRRMLSLAIAFVHQPEVILLDEPTTGLDPEIRRAAWRVISKMVKGRAIVLTTHSMEEAEALSTRIGIMVSGSLRCLGTPLHLKSKYGSGYQLTIIAGTVTGPDGQRPADAIHALVLQRAPQATLVNDSATSSGMMIFRIPRDNTRISALFQSISAPENQWCIAEWSFAQTSLEDVFIKVAEQDQEPLLASPNNHDNNNENNHGNTQSNSTRLASFV